MFALEELIRAISESRSAFFLMNSVGSTAWSFEILAGDAGLSLATTGGRGGIVVGGADEGMKLGGGPGGAIEGTLASAPFSPESPLTPLASEEF